MSRTAAGLIVRIRILATVESSFESRVFHDVELPYRTRFDWSLYRGESEAIEPPICHYPGDSPLEEHVRHDTHYELWRPDQYGASTSR